MVSKDTELAENTERLILSVSSALSVFLPDK
jgi:hypothetical protein